MQALKGKSACHWVCSRVPDTVARWRAVAFDNIPDEVVVKLAKNAELVMSAGMFGNRTVTWGRRCIGWSAAVVQRGLTIPLYYATARKA